MDIPDISKKEGYIEAFDSYHAEIYKYIYLRVNYRKEVAEDITQDIFIKVWKYRKKFNKEKAGFRTWVYRIAKNTLVDYYRADKSSESVELLSEQVGELDLELEVIQSEQARILVAKMELLPEAQRELLILRYVQDLDIREVAEIVGKKYNATKVAIHRALGSLKEVVSK